MIMIDLMNSFRFNCSEGLKSCGFRELKKSIPSFRPYLLSKHNNEFYADVSFKEVNPLIDIYYNKEFKVYATCDAERKIVRLEAKSKQHKGYVDVWKFDLNWLFSSLELRQDENKEIDGFFANLSEYDKTIVVLSHIRNLEWVMPYIASTYHSNPIPSGTSKKAVKFDRTKYMMMDGVVLRNN